MTALQKAFLIMNAIFLIINIRTDNTQAIIANGFIVVIVILLWIYLHITKGN